MIELQLATTVDILKELRRRKLHFAFIGYQKRNREEPTIYAGCQGEYPEEILGLISLLRECVHDQIDKESTN
jgi:hypothetical protein